MNSNTYISYNFSFFTSDNVSAHMTHSYIYIIFICLELWTVTNHLKLNAHSFL